jgi:hypothetical protein
MRSDGVQAKLFGRFLDGRTDVVTAVASYLHMCGICAEVAGRRCSECTCAVIDDDVCIVFADC